MKDLPDSRRGWVSQVLEFYTNKSFQSFVIHGDLTIDDPARDFLNIYEDGGMEFLVQVSEHYPILPQNDLNKCIQLKLSARPIYLAAYCLKTGMEEDYKRQLQVIRPRIMTF